MEKSDGCNPLPSKHARNKFNDTFNMYYRWGGEISFKELRFVDNYSHASIAFSYCVFLIHISACYPGITVCAWTDWYSWEPKDPDRWDSCEYSEVQCRQRNDHSVGCDGQDALDCTENCEEFADYELTLLCCKRICPTGPPSTTPSEEPTTTTVGDTTTTTVGVTTTTIGDTTTTVGVTTTTTIGDTTTTTVGDTTTTATTEETTRES